MTLGVVMLTHTAFERAAQLARHWSSKGCPVVIHVDKRVKRSKYDAFVKDLEDVENVLFSHRHRCEWGTWGIVAATQEACEMILARFPQVRHVFLASGSCLPLRPVEDLIEYLDAHPRTDFIESVTTEDVPWTVGGLDEERFTLRFPFSWKSQRRLFDRYTALQRRVGFKRRLPHGIVPHLGSQWWCLTRQTLSAILEDPDRDLYDRYFSKVWIPDESYFQSLVRLYSIQIESRSLTLSKFDFQGKPHIFYDDHLQLLRRSDCFVARKIWPHANRLYNTFLAPGGGIPKSTEPSPGKIDRIFAKALERRTRGRPGLYMQSRFPHHGWENGVTAGEYSIFEGFDLLFENFDTWLTKNSGARVHGHLFANDRIQWAGRETHFNGALSDSVKIRDYNSHCWFRSLIWNTRGERQAFMFGPHDFQAVSWHLAVDQNAHFSVITGAWAIPLFRANRNFSELRKEAAWLQKTESDHIEVLRSAHTRAKVQIWSLAEFLQNPMEPLQEIIDTIGPKAARRLTEAPRMVDLRGFGKFVQNLKNQGMNPHLVGDFPVNDDFSLLPVEPRRPYVVK